MDSTELLVTRISVFEGLERDEVDTESFDDSTGMLDSVEAVVNVDNLSVDIGSFVVENCRSVVVDMT